jgi:hypothetical protein
MRGKLTFMLLAAGFDPNRLTLYSSDAHLEDDCTLIDYNVQAESTLFLFVAHPEAVPKVRMPCSK